MADTESGTVAFYLSDGKQLIKLRLKPSTLFSNMATQSVCLFNKFGYCKHQEMCRKLRVKELCENNSCDFSTCKWYWNYGRCKFDKCAFKNIENMNSSENINHECDKVMSKLINVELAIKSLEEKEKQTINTIDKLMEMETKKN